MKMYNPTITLQRGLQTQMLETYTMFVFSLPEYVEHLTKQLILVLPSGGQALRQFGPKKLKKLFFWFIGINILT